jgi:hypothetical protein
LKFIECANLGIQSLYALGRSLELILDLSRLGAVVFSSETKCALRILKLISEARHVDGRLVFLRK